MNPSDQFMQSQEWSIWAPIRIDELVQTALNMNDEDFDVPDDMTVKHAKNFVSQMGRELDQLKIGLPSMWVSQNGEVVFQWKREGARLEFKFTPNEMFVFVSNEQKTWSEKHPHSLHEPHRLLEAFDLYRAA